MSAPIKPARTETLEQTISGPDLFNEAERIRDYLAEIRNDINAIDRAFERCCLGRSSKSSSHGELKKFTMGELRNAEASYPVGI